MAPSDRLTPALRIVLLLGLGFAILIWLAPDGPKSDLWWTEALLIALLVLQVRRAGRRTSRNVPAAPAYLALVWLFGMVFELSLTADGSGLGGYHPDTGTSFLLAQGDYLLLGLGMLWAIRLVGAGFRAAAWIAGGAGLTEALVFTDGLAQAIGALGYWGILPASCYFALVYWLFLALPVLCLPPGALVSRAERAWPAPVLVGLGFAVGIAARLIFGWVYLPALAILFGLTG